MAGNNKGYKNGGAMAAIEAVTSHYNAQEQREISVPEWSNENGDAMVFYCRPFTLQDQNKLQFAIKDGNEANALAEIIFLKALNEDGERVFSVADKQLLRTKADATVVARVANEVMGNETIEGIEKN